MTTPLECPFLLEPKCLSKQSILVVGALGTLGQAVSLELAQRGAELILIDRHVKELERLYDKITALSCPEPALHGANLMTLGVEEAQTIAEHIQQLYGKLNGMVFCSGYWGTLTPIEHYPEKTWLEVMHLNVNLPFLLTKHLLPLLKSTADSRIIYTESPLSFTTKAYHGPFNAAQSALRTFIAGLALETYTPSPKVLGINPQALRSKSRAKLYPGLNDSGYEPQDVAAFYSAMLMHGHDYHGKTYHLPPLKEVSHASVVTESELCQS